MKNNIKRILTGLFTLLIAFLTIAPIQVWAEEGENAAQVVQVQAPAETNENALLYATSYSVTNETIIPGKSFTLKMTIQNFSANETAKNIVVLIDNPDGVVPEYGTVSVAYIDSLKPKAATEVTFNYNADTAIEASELDFLVYMTCDKYNTSTPIRISVGKDGDISVENVSVPEKVTLNKTDYVSALIENISGKEVNNVTMVVKCDDEEIATETIGKLSIGTSKTQNIEVKFDKEGEHSYEILLKYTNSDGENKEFTAGTGKITVTTEQVETNRNNIKEDDSANDSKSNTFSGNNIVIICSVGVLVIAICCIVLVLLYRKK